MFILSVEIFCKNCVGLPSQCNTGRPLPARRAYRTRTLHTPTGRRTPTYADPPPDGRRPGIPPGRPGRPPWQPLRRLDAEPLSEKPPCLRLPPSPLPCARRRTTTPQPVPGRDDGRGPSARPPDKPPGNPQKKPLSPKGNRGLTLLGGATATCCWKAPFQWLT